MEMFVKLENFKNKEEAESYAKKNKIDCRSVGIISQIHNVNLEENFREILEDIASNENYEYDQSDAQCLELSSCDKYVFFKESEVHEYLNRYLT